MPGYAEFADVQTRAGRYGGALTVAGAHPNQADVEQILTDLSAQVDVAIRARGYDVASLDVTVKAALRELVAYGALARALAGIPDGGDELEKLQTYASRLWGAAMGDPTAGSSAGQKGSIGAGTHPAIMALEAGEAGSGGQSGGSFWDDEPSFGTPAQVAAELRSTPAELAPAFAKSQSL